MNNDIDSDFYVDLDVFVRAEYDKVISYLIGKSMTISSMTLSIPVDNKFIEKYQLNEKISFSLALDSFRSGQIKYGYEGIEIKPDCHFITPDYYVPVPTLTVIREAIKQNTHKPDIKPLELELARANGLVNKDNMQVIEILD